LVEAQRKAVEKAVGVTLRGSTVVEQAVNIQQTVRANVGGTIRRYEVLWERAEDSFYKVRIRAVVLYRPPGEDGRPARAVRVCVRVAGDKVASAIRAALLDADFQLSDDQASADVVVTGGVETSGRSDSRLGGFFSHQAKAFLDVLDLRTGKVDQRSFEASAIDLSDQAAYDAALEKAGQGSGIAIATLLEEPDELRLSRLERADRL
jgi:hypothetical protein